MSRPSLEVADVIGRHGGAFLQKYGLRAFRGFGTSGAQTAAVKDWKDRYRLLTGQDPDLCPACKLGRLIAIQALLPISSKVVVGYNTS